MEDYVIGTHPVDGYSSSYHYGGIGDGDPMGFDFFGRIGHELDGTTAQNRYNAEQPALQRQHELYMSNTSYQRAVADMKAAGLNPASLSGMNGSGSGASSSSSSGASASTRGAKTGTLGTILMLLGRLLLIK